MNLPIEINFLILDNLTYREEYTCLHVCKQWYKHIISKKKEEEKKMLRYASFFYKDSSDGYYVYIGHKDIIIYSASSPNSNLDGKFIRRMWNVRKFFITHHARREMCEKDITRCHTILIEISNKKYMYISDDLFKFTTEDNILGLHSKVSSNDGCYFLEGIAIGEKYIYFVNSAAPVFCEKSLYPTEEYWNLDFVESILRLKSRKKFKIEKIK